MKNSSTTESGSPSENIGVLHVDDDPVYLSLSRAVLENDDVGIAVSSAVESR